MRYSAHALKGLMLLAAALATSSCGNVIQGATSKNGLNAAAGTITSTSDAPGTYSDGDYTCPNTPNVVWFGSPTPERYDPYLDGSGYYTVCPHKTSPTQILMHGKPHFQATTICLYPVKYNSDSSSFSWVVDQSGLIVYRCENITATGVYSNFPNTTFNGLLVVESSLNAAFLNQCLQGQGCSSSPYSLGRFRQ